MRIAVTGKTGQVVTALVERGGLAGVDVFTIGRPEIDLAKPVSILPTLTRLAPDVVVSAAAYTAVDKAESEPEIAFMVNAQGPALIATAAHELGVPVIHLSTDYVFDGRKASPYDETDQPGALSVYGQTKLAGEQAVRIATRNSVILRTAWVYSPFGSNFLKTMLRLAGERPEIRVVDDQRGNPTSALDIADAILKVAQNLVTSPQEIILRDTFHLAGSGEASWADFATEIFALSGATGGPSAKVTRINAAEYPTPAPRPANSRLSSKKLQVLHGVTMPDWRASTREVVERLLRPNEQVKSMEQ